MRISGPRGPASVVLGAVALALVVVGVVSVVALRASSGGDPEAPTAPTPVAVVAPSARSVSVVRAVASLAVLRDWDRARAAAWASGEVAALRRLYVPGSPAGRRDIAMLRAWGARGLQVEGMGTQVLAVELRARTARRIVLVVTDRLVGAVAVRGGARRDLPRDAPTTRRLVFRLAAGRWLLASAQEVTRPAASPVASTADTSESAKS